MSSDSQELICTEVPALDEKAGQRAEQRWDTRTKPPGSLGRLEDISVRLAAITGCCPPHIRRVGVVVAAADHGVGAEGTSAYPQEVTRQMVRNFARGGAAVNVLARRRQAKVTVIDAGLMRPVDEPSILDKRAGPGTKNMTRGPAMSTTQLEFCLQSGAQLAEDMAEDVDVVALGEMGIGNTTAASAVSAALLGVSPSEVTGPGTGLDREGVCHKTHVVRRALQVNRPDLGDPVDVLRKVGGFEIAFLAGFALSACQHRLPVVLDGFICCAAALCAAEVAQGLSDYLFAGHLSCEPGHRLILDRLGLEPLLTLQMRLGEASGAAAALGIVADSAALLGGMASFSSAGVSDGEKRRR